jgi:hypothetical protein
MSDSEHEAWLTSVKDSRKLDARLDEIAAANERESIGVIPFYETLSDELRVTMDDVFRRYRRVLSAYRLWGWGEDDPPVPQRVSEVGDVCDVVSGE